MLAARSLCACTTPFGRPVLPDEKIMYAGVVGATAAIGSPGSADSASASIDSDRVPAGNVAVDSATVMVAAKSCSVTSR
jgi:hypothetical protein